MSATTGQRPVRQVIGETLQELKTREQRLLGALTEVRTFIRALHEAAGVEHREEPLPPAATAGAPVKLRRISTAPITDSQRDEAVLQALADGPLGMSALLEKAAMTIGLVRPAMLRLRESGNVQVTGAKSTTRYWLTEQLDRHAAENDGRVPHEPQAVEA